MPRQTVLRFRTDYWLTLCFVADVLKKAPQEVTLMDLERDMWQRIAELMGDREE